MLRIRQLASLGFPLDQVAGMLDELDAERSRREPRFPADQPTADDILAELDAALQKQIEHLQRQRRVIAHLRTQNLAAVFPERAAGALAAMDRLAARVADEPGFMGLALSDADQLAMGIAAHLYSEAELAEIERVFNANVDRDYVDEYRKIGRAVNVLPADASAPQRQAAVDACVGFLAKLIDCFDPQNWLRADKDYAVLLDRTAGRSFNSAQIDVSSRFLASSRASSCVVGMGRGIADDRAWFAKESSAPDAAAAALASMMGIAAATASFAWARRSNWSIQRTDVEVASPRLPQAFDRMRIVHVSDLHNAEFGPGNARLLNAIRRAAPDVIFITGDLVDSRQTRTEVAVRFVAAAARIASVYYVPGNHGSRLDEYPQMKASLKRVGATVLANRSVCLARDGECVRVAGVMDPAFTAPHARGLAASVMEGNLSRALQSAGDGGRAFTLLLASSSCCPYMPAAISTSRSQGMPMAARFACRAWAAFRP